MLINFNDLFFLTVKVKGIINIGAHKLLNEHGIINIDLLKAKFLFNNIKKAKV